MKNNMTMNYHNYSSAVKKGKNSEKTNLKEIDNIKKCNLSDKKVKSFINYTVNEEDESIRKIRFQNFMTSYRAKNKEPLFINNLFCDNKIDKGKRFYHTNLRKKSEKRLIENLLTGSTISTNLYIDISNQRRGKFIQEFQKRNNNYNSNYLKDNYTRNKSKIKKGKTSNSNSKIKKNKINQDNKEHSSKKDNCSTIKLILDTNNKIPLNKRTNSEDYNNNIKDKSNVNDINIQDKNSKVSKNCNRNNNNDNFSFKYYEIFPRTENLGKYYSTILANKDNFVNKTRKSLDLSNKKNCNILNDNYKNVKFSKDEINEQIIKPKKIRKESNDSYVKCIQKKKVELSQINDNIKNDKKANINNNPCIKKKSIDSSENYKDIYLKKFLTKKNLNNNKNNADYNTVQNINRTYNKINYKILNNIEVSKKDKNKTINQINKNSNNMRKENYAFLHLQGLNYLNQKQELSKENIPLKQKQDSKPEGYNFNEQKRIKDVNEFIKYFSHLTSSK